MAALRPDTNKSHDLGDSSKKWGSIYVGDVQAESGTVSGNFEIQGNLTVTGTQTSLQVSTVEAEDPLIKLARGNSGDTLDVGFYGQTNNGAANEFHGLARDADDSKFYLFEGVTTEPSTTMPDVSSNIATLVANVEGAVTGNADTASALETARTIQISGDVAGSADFDGSAAINIDAIIQAGSVENGMLAGSIADSKLAQDYIQVGEVDDSSVQWTGTQLQVKASGITNDMLAGSIADGKLAQDYIQTSEVDDSSIEWDGVGSHLQVKELGITNAMLAGSISDAKLAEDYVKISEVDDSSIEWDGVGGHLQVKALGITNAMLAGSIENAKLINSSVSFGGISVSLGGSDATPAFDLSDATNYPASSLSGSVADGQLAQDYIQITEVDDSSIEWDGVGSHLQVKALGITNAMLAGSIENAKLSNSSVSFGGVSVSLGGSDATPAFNLADATGYPASALVGNVSDSQLDQDYVKISEVDDSSIEWDGVGSHLQVKALGITNAMLAGSIENAKLSNSSVSLGGVSVSLGGSDATPAFDLSDATNYPASSLTGTVSDLQLELDYIQTSEVDDSSIEWDTTQLRVKASGITNAMLAGSIENAKLSNSTVSYGGVQLSLGGSDATPAFDLSDATNYPTSALVGTISNDQLAGSIANSKLANSGFDLQVGGASQEDINLGDSLNFAAGSNATVGYNSSTNTLTFNTANSLTGVDTDGNAGTATALETARDFSITGSEITASAVSFNGSGDVALNASITAGAIANSKLANPGITVADVSANSETINLGDTLYFGGTSNEIEVTYSTSLNKFTFGLPNAVVTTTLETSGGLTVGGNATITGNITASGLTASGANVTFADNLIELGVNNTDLEDIGFYGQRGDGLGGANGFAGISWDESESEFIAFTASTEPTTTVGTHTKAKLHVGALEINDAYSMPTADGSSNEFLKSNGSGTLSFGVPGRPFLSVSTTASGTDSLTEVSYAENIYIYQGDDADLVTVVLPNRPSNGYRVTIKNFNQTGTKALKYQANQTNSDAIEGQTGAQNLAQDEAISLVYYDVLDTWYRIANYG